MKWTLLPVIALTLLLAACGGAREPAAPATTPPVATGDITTPDDSATPGRTPTSGEATPPAAGTGPGLSIEEAQTSDAQGPLLVNGFIVAEGDVVRLCSALAESLPPQCGEPSLEVVGIDLDDYPVKEAQGVAWTDEQVQVLGEVEDGVLRVSGDTAG